MKKSFLLFLIAALMAMAIPAVAQNSGVYAVNYNQATNSFGTINLTSGAFGNIASIHTTNINDIAWCPTNGMLYGISNQSVLVTINETNGHITKVVGLSQNVQTLAIRSDGVIFAGTAMKLFTINPVTGKTQPVGDYGSPNKLNKDGQNIRFAQDGNLYVSNVSTNTDIYQVNTSTGGATWMGEAVGCPYAVLGNAGTNMYGASTSSSTNTSAELVSFNLSSFVVGGTNADGSTHQITWGATGAGTNFPANVVFSGNNPPPSGPAPQLCCACAYCSGGPQFVVSWQSVANQNYQVLCTTNLGSGVWTPVGGSINGTGSSCAVTNNMNGATQCFFRLQLQ